jgi:SulP family sulfate permease
MNWVQIFPFLKWSKDLKSPGVVGADLVAGITVALVLIPQSMAYAQLAGLPPYYGLYAAFLPGIIGALWGSSKQLATGPVAVVSLLTASALAPFAAMGTEQFVALAIMLAMLVGIFQLCLGLFKLGVVVSFLSHPVIVGFTNAAAIIIGLSQLNKIFGVPKPRSENFINDIWVVLQQIGDTHMVTLLMGVSAFVIMWVMKKYVPKVPGVLVAVVATTFVSWSMGFEALGGKVVGIIPSGLPAMALPVIDFSMASTLFTSVMVISLVGFMEAISIAKAMAAKTKDRIDPNKELIGQGLANIVGSMSQSYPVSGSFSRSAVNLNAGAKTGMSAVFTGAVVLITLLFLTPLLYHLPQAVLAAVIMMAVTGLINFKAIKHAWQAHKHDGVASIVTFVATLAFAPHLDKGIMIGASLALGLYLYRTMSPRVAVLGRYAKDNTLRDISVHPNLPTDERIVAVRYDGSLYFANVSYFEDAILGACADYPSARYVLVVADGINQLDASGEEMLHLLVERLSGNSVTLVFSGLKRQVLDVMRKTGLYSTIGAQNIFATENHALKAIYEWMAEGGAEDEESFCPLLPEQKRKVPEERVPF